MDDFLRDFLNDTKEDLDKIESNLVSLEKSIVQGEEIDFDMVNAIFRHYHSIKGSSGFFELKEVVRVAHQAENILDLFRKKHLIIESDHLDAIYRVHDFIAELVERVEKNGHDKGLEDRADSLIEDLRAVESHRMISKPDQEKIAKPKKFGLFAEEEGLKAESAKVGNKADTEENASADVDSSNQVDESLSSANSDVEEENLIIINDADVQVEAKKQISQSIEIKDIRISTDKLDSLMDLLGELVIVEAMVSRHANDEILNVEMLRRSTSQLSKVTRYLQEIGLSMRMVPVQGLFQKMTRLVRDLSRKSGKNVKFETHGEETEIDKTIIEHLSDPLVHIIRNALDHGMETSEQRMKANKPAAGLIKMEAMHKGNEIWIVIKDDGRGLNREKILAKAVEHGLIESVDVDWRDNQVWELIFHPGFSTAEKITDISGRGVGMDVVRKNITRLKGKIDVESVSGEGTTFYLRIPLTLAIIEAMVVKYSDRYYIIPTENIERFIDLNVMQVSDIHDHQQVVRINDQLISVVDLNEIFHYSTHKENHDERIAVVIGKKGDFVAIRLDAIIGSQQVVVKPLDEAMEHLKGLSGSAILGDGEVGLIIDADFIVKLFSNEEEEQIEQGTSKSGSSKDVPLQGNKNSTL